MALVDHNGEAEFPVSKDRVFDAMCTAIPTIKGLTVDSADKFLGRIIVKGGVSLASWGENVPIQLTALDDNRTKVSITSSPKTGIMLGGANDMGKNRKNIERILSATSQLLQNQMAGQSQLPQSFTQPSQQSQPSSYQQPAFIQPRPAKKKMGIGKKILIGIGILFVIGIIANMGKEKENKVSNVAISASAQTETKADATTNYPTLGQTLQTRYFEVTITKAGLTNKLNTGNEFTDEKAGEGNQFLVMQTTFKNIDNESRMLTDGSVFINYNGKDYEFDKSETIMAEGYGLFLDQINPLTSKTTKLVYKIPAEIKGPAYYRPGRADDDQKIFLGNLK